MWVRSTNKLQCWPRLWMQQETHHSYPLTRIFLFRLLLLSPSQHSKGKKSTRISQRNYPCSTHTHYSHLCPLYPPALSLPSHSFSSIPQTKLPLTLSIFLLLIYVQSSTISISISTSTDREPERESNDNHANWPWCKILLPQLAGRWGKRKGGKNAIWAYQE